VIKFLLTKEIFIQNHLPRDVLILMIDLSDWWNQKTRGIVNGFFSLVNNWSIFRLFKENHEGELS
jgi:hypothetical protein